MDVCMYVISQILLYVKSAHAEARVQPHVRVYGKCAMYMCTYLRFPSLTTFNTYHLPR